MHKTRFVLVSDTHNASPPSSFQLPVGDVLIHAGDLTKNGTPKELCTALAWIEKADFQAKIVIAGNHDVGLDTNIPEEESENRDKSVAQAVPQDKKAEDVTCMLRNYPSITYLNHESKTIRLLRPPCTEFEVFGSPYSPVRQGAKQSHEILSSKHCAFQYTTAEPASSPWDDIPLMSIDVLVTHVPPLSHCDDEGNGCPLLQRAMTRVRPRLAVCGHVHKGRGVEVVKYAQRAGASASNVACDIDGLQELEVSRWKDPAQATKKLAKVDLTGNGRKLVPEDWEAVVRTPAGSIAQNYGESALISLPGQTMFNVEHQNPSFDRGQTCIVNAAIMSTSWPYQSGSQRFNKPIVLDIDLPTWRDQ
jgi:Icc-related predicted phosphoesterase